MTPPTNPISGMGKGMLYIFWILAIIGLSYVFGLWENKQYNPNQHVQSSQDDNSRVVELKRNRMGHYISSGMINGHKVVFMLDTGATTVAVPEAVARKLGLNAGQVHKVYTANGTANAYNTRIATLQLGQITLNDLRASITPGMKGQEILLGMSALKQLDFSQSGNVLTLIQHK